MKLEGKVVLITGASEGIGAACVESFRRRGAEISVVARSREKLERVTGTDAVITAGDLLSESTRRQAVEGSIERFGRIDILINNAGIGLYNPSWRADMDDIRYLMELNLITPIRLTQLVVPGMIEQGSGMIVNVGSIGGKLTLPWMTVYSASKYALGSLTDGLRIELKDTGVKTMTVCPGYVKTGFHDHLLSGKVPAAIQRSRKMAITPEQCAEAIARGVEKEKRTVMAPAAGWVLIAVARLCPSLVDWQMHRMYRSAEKG